MGEMTSDFPPGLRRWIEQRLAEGRYADAADYIRDLVRRDQEGLIGEAAENTAAETPEDIAWVREQVAIGIASGVCEQNAFEVLDEIRATRESRRG